MWGEEIKTTSHERLVEMDQGDFIWRNGSHLLSLGCSVTALVKDEQTVTD